MFKEDENDLVVLRDDNTPVTTSLMVAKTFEKEHRNVLKDIENLQCPNEFRELNFQLSSYISKQNKELPMYVLTKDGFTFLAMGYTGEKAAKFKVTYINAFNVLGQLIQSDDFIIKRYNEVMQRRLEEAVKQIKTLQQHNEALEVQTEKQKDIIIQSAPKVDYYDNVLASTNTYTTTQIAKELDITGVTLNKRLSELGIIYRQSQQWLLYSRYHGKGYTATRTHHYVSSNGASGTQTLTVWTEKGREFLHSIKSKLNPNLNLSGMSDAQYI